MEAGRVVTLKPREVSALLHIAGGGTVVALASRLQISKSAACMLLHRLYRRLDVANGTQAVYRAVSLGLIPSEPRPSADG
ncbi:MAG: hypothetical protein JWP11_2843 [Frankiales bacterium]|nr:hypothetical protein [Frankiales bacterium]